MPLHRFPSCGHNLSVAIHPKYSLARNYLTKPSPSAKVLPIFRAVLFVCRLKSRTNCDLQVKKDFPVTIFIYLTPLLVIPTESRAVLIIKLTD